MNGNLLAFFLPSAIPNRMTALIIPCVRPKGGIGSPPRRLMARE